MVYPFYDIYDIYDAVVGSVLGTASWKERRLPYEGVWDFQFTADNTKYQSRVQCRKILDFSFVIAGVAAMVFGLLGARHLRADKRHGGT